MAYMEKRLPGYGQNYIIKNKQDIEEVRLRSARLAAVTAQVDTKLTYAAKPMRNVKKEMIAEERYALIEKDNLLLLQRMHAVSERARAPPPTPAAAAGQLTALARSLAFSRARRRSCTARPPSTT
jgi:hypothetical protein